MTGYKCDRCGKFFHVFIVDGGEIPLIGLADRQYRIEADLCPECANQLKLWLTCKTKTEVEK